MTDLMRISTPVSKGQTNLWNPFSPATPLAAIEDTDADALSFLLSPKVPSPFKTSNSWLHRQKGQVTACVLCSASLGKIFSALLRFTQQQICSDFVYARELLSLLLPASATLCLYYYQLALLLSQLHLLLSPSATLSQLLVTGNQINPYA